MNKKFLILILIIFTLQLIAQPKTSKISSLPGAFSRLGFGARGMALGNAMTAVIEGELNSYYNPAINPFNQDNQIQLGYSFLSLDRKLNFVQLNKIFKQYRRDVFGNKTNEIHSRAGLSIGLINFGIDNIDGRDNSGIKTQIYSISENMFFLSVGISPSNKLSIGVTAEYYHNSLFDKMTSTAVGFDLGFIYRLTDYLTIGGFVGDINAKYRWDSTPLYKEEGNNFYDYFPTIKRIGLSYNLPANLGFVSSDFEFTNFGTRILKLGCEISPVEFLQVRAGVDRINLVNKDMIPKLSFGFGLNHTISGKLFEINYAFVTEPYSPSNQHIISLGIIL